MTQTPTTRAARATGTAISRRGTRSARAIALVSLSLVGTAACGSSTHRSFAWFGARAAPPSWTLVRIADGAQLAYPPGWRRAAGDPGTATADLVDAKGRFLGYLNVTPRQGAEQPAGWGAFRVAHNRQEGDREVRELGTATGLRFLDGRGSCVEDSYRTVTNARYIEIACIVRGPASASVIVAAAPPAGWPRMSPVLERAVEGFRA